ncbi:hypothetical protein QFZ89_007554 [Paraburkholderia youngii]
MNGINQSSASVAALPSAWLDSLKSQRRGLLSR